MFDCISGWGVCGENTLRDFCRVSERYLNQEMVGTVCVAPEILLLQILFLLRVPVFFFFFVYIGFFIIIFSSPVIYISSCLLFWKHGNMFMHSPFPPHVLLFELSTQSSSYILHFQCLLLGRRGPALRFKGLSSADSQKRCDEGHKIDAKQQSPCHKECFFLFFSPLGDSSRQLSEWRRRQRHLSHLGLSGVLQ